VRFKSYITSHYILQFPTLSILLTQCRRFIDIVDIDDIDDVLSTNKVDASTPIPGCNVNSSIAGSAQIQLFEKSNKTRENEQNGQVVIVNGHRDGKNLRKPLETFTLCVLYKIPEDWLEMRMADLQSGQTSK
jgi:hypothetical protein